MPALDKIHHAVKAALIKNGWEIIRGDPVKIDGLSLHIDLFARTKTDEVVFASDGYRYIAVEVKSLDEPSIIHALGPAVGQYDLYRYVLGGSPIAWTVYLAVSLEVWNSFFTGKPQTLNFLQSRQIHIVIIDTTTQEVAQWIEQ